LRLVQPLTTILHRALDMPALDMPALDMVARVANRKTSV
jgi:hypothetical protein